MSDPNVDPSNPAAIQAALAGTFQQMDTAINRARQYGVPICLSFLTAIRDSADAVEIAGQAADRRNMQWYSRENMLASNWSTYSRYARKQSRLQEAYMREVGRRLGKRMAQYPDIVVAASGDGEVELAYSPSVQVVDQPETATDKAVLADYSPFTIAEFRDWLRQGGLYAPGQPFAGEAWEFSSRYAGDASPGSDTNGDGHTLNGDFSCRSESSSARGTSNTSTGASAALPTGTPARFRPLLTTARAGRRRPRRKSTASTHRAALIGVSPGGSSGRCSVSEWCGGTTSTWPVG